MRLRSVYRLLAAAVCAGGATYLTVSAFGPRPSAPGPLAAATDARPLVKPDTAAVPETRTVIVAAVPLRFGTPLTADVLTEVQWPAASVPPGAFASREALLGPGGQRTVLGAIAKSEPILASKVTGPGQRGSLAAVIGEGMMAATIRVDDVLGVAGFVQPGDRVNVLYTRNDRVPTPSGRAATGTAFSELLLQNVRVLAIDQIADRGPQAKPAKAVTIEVTAEGAQKVHLGAQTGQLSLALLPTSSRPATDHRRIDLEDLGNQKPGVKRVPVEHKDGDPTVVTVTRGTDRSLYEITESGGRELKLSSKGQVAVQPQAAAQPEQ